MRQFAVPNLNRNSRLQSKPHEPRQGKTGNLGRTANSGSEAS